MTTGGAHNMGIVLFMVVGGGKGTLWSLAATVRQQHAVCFRSNAARPRVRKGKEPRTLLIAHLPSLSPLTLQVAAVPAPLVSPRSC
jgi:hypothetical protein